MSKDNEMLDILPPDDRRALNLLIDIYGDDVLTVLNALHALSARLAIAAGVNAQDFGAGVKHHWDFVVDVINDAQRPHSH